MKHQFKTLVRPAVRLARNFILGMRTRNDIAAFIANAEPSENHIALMDRFSAHTMTSRKRQTALLAAADYIGTTGILGDIIECGVWRGGNIMMIKSSLRARGISRGYWLYDTFTGMAEPAQIDVAMDGSGPAIKTYRTLDRGTHNEWCYTSIDDVKANFKTAGLFDDTLHFVVGKVEDTLRDPRNLPSGIAILRLDTDWYTSTRLELEVLYPRLVTGGVLLIDDYRDWRGCHEATNEYFHHTTTIFAEADGCRIAIKR